MENEYAVNFRLPQHGARVMCYGHRTFCCVEDMEPDPDWHEVMFTMNVSSWRMKSELPEDPEESVLQDVEVLEHWQVIGDQPHDHVIGVTKWKYCDKDTIPKYWNDPVNNPPDLWKDVIVLCIDKKGETYKIGEKYCAIDRLCKWNDTEEIGFRTERFGLGDVIGWFDLPPI